MKTRRRFLRRVGLLVLPLLYLIAQRLTSLFATPAARVPVYPLAFAQDTFLKGDLSGPGLKVSERRNLSEERNIGSP